MSKVITIEIFINRANIIHNNYYNYSLSVYKKSMEKIIIICPTHGEFKITPNSHLMGQGCGICGKNKAAKSRKTTNEHKINLFIKKCVDLHKNFYNYSKILLLSNFDYDSKVEIICPEHGSWMQRASKHMEGHGCRKCANKLISYTKEEMINRFIKLHVNLYDYSLVEYTGIYNNVKIICSIHSIFEMKPCHHLLKHGCIFCYNERKIIHNEEMRKGIVKFTNEANLIHNNKYDYSLVDYKNAWKKVKIICKAHGIFEQSPTLHTNKHKNGCPKCHHSISGPEIDWLDSLNIQHEYRNVSKTINGRCFKFDALINNIVYEFDGDFFHGNPEFYKKEDINPVTKTTFGSLYEKTLNKKNYLESNGFTVVSIWASEFERIKNENKN